MLSRVWNTQRGSWSYIGKGVRKKEIEVTRRTRGGVKRRQTDLGSNQFPKCSPQLERFTELSREKKGEGGDRGDLGEKKEG